MYPLSARCATSMLTVASARGIVPQPPPPAGTDWRRRCRSLAWGADDSSVLLLIWRRDLLPAPGLLLPLLPARQRRECSDRLARVLVGLTGLRSRKRRECSERLARVLAGLTALRSRGRSLDWRRRRVTGALWIDVPETEPISPPALGADPREVESESDDRNEDRGTSRLTSSASCPARVERRASVTALRRCSFRSRRLLLEALAKLWGLPPRPLVCRNDDPR